eukprot:TRINITY_DN3897_c0_g1_i2.p1 TRINITY_DN3897_c0_g1~~TRINITY_DN3897_c0_g1_i2.p1  ORF type:complete len:911 (+),score=171.87 TRINITY_DN3897_c0_g1_i2:243-2975(+)
MNPTQLGGAAAATTLRRTVIANKPGETPQSESESESEQETKPPLIRKATLETEEDLKTLISLGKTRTITRQIELKIKEEKDGSAASSTPTASSTTSTSPTLAPRSPRSGSSPPRIEAATPNRRSRTLSLLSRSPHQIFDRKRAFSASEELAKTSSSLEGFETDSDSMDTSNEEESTSYISSSSGSNIMSTTRNITIPKAEKTLVSIVSSETKVTTQELVDSTTKDGENTTASTPTQTSGLEEYLPTQKRLTRTKLDKRSSVARDDESPANSSVLGRHRLPSSSTLLKYFEENPVDASEDESEGSSQGQTTLDDISAGEDEKGSKTKRGDKLRRLKEKRNGDSTDFSSGEDTPTSTPNSPAKPKRQSSKLRLLNMDFKHSSSHQESVSPRAPHVPKADIGGALEVHSSGSNRNLFKEKGGDLEEQRKIWGMLSSPLSPRSTAVQVFRNSISVDKQENEKSEKISTSSSNSISNVAISNASESTKKKPASRDSVILPPVSDSSSDKMDRSTKDTLSYLEKQKKKLVSEVHKLTEDLGNLTQSIEKLQDKKKRLLAVCGKLDEERKALSLRTSKITSTPSPSEANKRKIKDKDKERSNSFTSFDPSFVEFGKLLSLIPGRSGAMVYCCYVNGWECVAKQIDLTSARPAKVESLQREVDILSGQVTPHPNIVKYLGHESTATKLTLFISKYDSTLRHVLDEQRKKGERYPPAKIAKYGLEILSGLQHLHSLSIMHRDLKADNVFVRVGSSGQITKLVIGDFDTAKKITPYAKAASFVGTAGFMAAEVFKRNTLEEDPSAIKGYSFKADIFSYGMLLYELITLKRPYEEIEMPVINIFDEVEKGAPPRVQACDLNSMFSPLINLHRQCIQRNPEDRPPLEKIAEELTSISLDSTSVPPPLLTYTSYSNLHHVNKI